MATKVKAEKFDRINREQMNMKGRSMRTRTGAFKTGKIRAHGKHYKHL